MYEWEIKEVIDAAFVEHGADSLHAFPHIVGSGPNTLELHYPGGGRMVEDGDLVLVDIGARYGGYCGDITRTYPANGTFTSRQRDIYQLVLDAQSAVAEAWRPGVHSLDDMYYFTLDYFRDSSLRALDEYGAEQTMDAFFPHHIGHYIGTDVHGEDLWLDPALPAQVGHVFAIEPGLYIPSEGIGIRIEDDYVLTSEGAVNLAPVLPKTPDDIEGWMAGTLP
jgi:Xaa-Pro aminopeptidase